MRRSAAGYTLLEMVVVITLLGILTGITYVRLGPALTEAKVRSAASLMATDLQQAQMLSVRLREPVVFDVNAGALRYTLRNRAADTVYAERVFGPGTEHTVDEFTASPAIIEFFPNGIASANATYVVGFQGYRRQVTITQAGQLRIAHVP